MSWSGCNPLSTQDDVAAALAGEGTSIYAWHGMSTEEFYWCIDRTLEFEPTLTLDDGADLIFSVHSKHAALADVVIGGTEETTTGVHRLRAMAADGKFKYPVYAINDSETKWDFDNVYGTGQSSLDGILRATSVFLAGKTSAGRYCHCGRGVAMRRAWALRHHHRDRRPRARGASRATSCHGRGGQGRRYLHHRHRDEGRHPRPLQAMRTAPSSATPGITTARST
jgi:adenosylhomocysteinase